MLCSVQAILILIATISRYVMDCLLRHLGQHYLPFLIPFQAAFGTTVHIIPTVVIRVLFIHLEALLKYVRQGTLGPSPREFGASRLIWR